MIKRDQKSQRNLGNVTVLKITYLCCVLFSSEGCMCVFTLFNIPSLIEMTGPFLLASDSMIR